MDPLPEPWLRGPVAGISPLLSPLLYAFQHTREDLAKAIDGMNAAQLWARPHGLTPLGFHLRHIAGSVDRLITYLEGRALTAEQLRVLHAENEPGEGRAELLAAVDASLARAEAVVRRLDPACLADARTVGRQKLPTTVAGLLTHIAEHTLRHVGQAVTTAKIVREGQ